MLRDHELLLVHFLQQHVLFLRLPEQLQRVPLVGTHGRAAVPRLPAAVFGHVPVVRVRDPRRVRRELRRSAVPDLPLVPRVCHSYRGVVHGEWGMRGATAVPDDVLWRGHLGAVHHVQRRRRLYRVQRRVFAEWCCVCRVQCGVLVHLHLDRVQLSSGAGIDGDRPCHVRVHRLRRGWHLLRGGRRAARTVQQLRGGELLPHWEQQRGRGDLPRT